MRHGTGARCDRVSAALARLLLVLAALLSTLALTALLAHVPLPLWAWIAAAPDTLALTVLAAVRMATPHPSLRPFGNRHA